MWKCFLLSNSLKVKIKTIVFYTKRKTNSNLNYYYKAYFSLIQEKILKNCKALSIQKFRELWKFSKS